MDKVTTQLVPYNELVREWSFYSFIIGDSKTILGLRPDLIKMVLKCNEDGTPQIDVVSKKPIIEQVIIVTQQEFTEDEYRDYISKKMVKN